MLDPPSPPLRFASRLCFRTQGLWGSVGVSQTTPLSALAGAPTAACGSGAGAHEAACCCCWNRSCCCCCCSLIS